MSLYHDPDGEFTVDFSKILKREDIFPKGINTKKYKVIVECDLTKETDEDIRYDIVEETVDNLRELIYEKVKDIPRGERLNNMLDDMYEAVKNVNVK